MKRLLLLALTSSLLALGSARAAVPLLDARLTGTNTQVASGTLTVASGASLVLASGSTFTLTAPLTLANGGLGVALTDPNADRLLFWDDSAGAMAFLTLGTGLTISGTTLNTNQLTAAPTLDFPSIAASGATQSLTITVTGATVGSAVALGLPAAPPAGVVFEAFVSAADTVTIRATNCTAAAIDPASATYRVTVFVP